ncbi:hypothetical protein [Novosphingobium terrae]|uniref:hypothetical protein n=1 Tax=Novosphingobium terrae TaxID=2726189 RepID=UPI00197D4DE3|nr:hypothetical protein [Novosphingobium terrae]
MKDISLLPDCTHCAALCCMALAFDRSSQFAIDKEAGQACPNLHADGGCTIHARRADLGFHGCISFDCLGAGQRATALFAGRDWRSDPSLIEPISGAFSALLRVHKYLSMLDLVATLDMFGAERENAAALRRRLEEIDLQSDDMAALQTRIDGFLQSLKGYVQEAR